VDRDAPLCVLLLPGVLEQVPFARRGEDLLRAPNVVAVEPARRAPGVFVENVARRLARRLPGTPRVVVAFRETEYPLARSLFQRHPDCELWYAGPEDHAREHAVLVFDAADDPSAAAFQLNDALWTRLEALGIAQR
jgi:hypothetical protein